MKSQLNSANLLIISFFALCIQFTWSQGCELTVDAGRDQFTCDPANQLQLNGTIITNFPADFSWIPTTGLDDPNILDPKVNLLPGKYKYKLKASSMSQNLIVNGDFESGPVGYSTDYGLVLPTGSLASGKYGIGDLVNDYDNSWRCSLGGNGNFFIGRSFSSVSNAWCQTVNTKPGEMFIFKFSAARFVKAIGPVSFVIEANGQVIGYSPAYLPNCRWIDIELPCFTAKSTSTTICIRELSSASNGFGLDDIVLIEKCKAEDDVELEVVDLDYILNIIPTPSCNSQEFTIEASSKLYNVNPNIKYIWSTDIGKITQNYGRTIKAKGSGVYKVKIVYNNGFALCEQEEEVTIDLTNGIDATLEVKGKPNCQKDIFDLVGIPESGSGFYTYTWTPSNKILSGQGTNHATANSPGKYILRITDKITGCETIKTVDVSGDASFPEGLISGDTLLNCQTLNASLLSSPTDTSIYNWVWITPNNTQYTNINQITLQSGGDVILVVTDKKSKCQDTVYWTIKEDRLLPKIELGNDLILDCNTTEHTLITAQEIQNASFIYEWTYQNGTTKIDSQLRDKQILESGKLKLRIINTDNHCESSDSIQITDYRSDPLLLIEPPLPLTCYNTKVDITAKITAKNEKIIWSTKKGNILNRNDLNILQVDQPGYYYIQVEDTLGHCFALDSIYVDQDNFKPIVRLKGDTIFYCKDTEKIIDASGSSSHLELKYTWTGTGTIKSGQGTNTLIVTSPGIYILTILDTVNGCTTQKQIKIEPDLNSPVVAINNPAVLNCKVTSIQLDGSALTNSGNPLKYTWTSTQNFPIGNSNTLKPDISKPGDYILTAEDLINGCTTSSTINVKIDTSSPIIDLGKDLDWTCSTNNLPLDLLNNTQGFNYSYQWSTSNGQIAGNTNQKSISALSPGVYTLRVTNSSNFCSTTEDIELISNQILPITLANTPAELNCIVKSVNIDSKGSSTGVNYIYSWKELTGKILSNATILTVSNSGKYILEIVDQTNNCIQSDTVEVIQNIQTPIIDAGSTKELTCTVNDLILQGTIQTPNSNYNIIWNTTNGRIIKDDNSLSPKIDQEGDYQITVTDLSNGCTSTDIVSITRDKNVPAKIDFLVAQPKCIEDPGLLSILNIIGGKPNYTVYLDGNQVDYNKPQNIYEGKHQIKVIDNNGCILIEETTIIPPLAQWVKIKSDVTIYEGDHYELHPEYSVPIDSIVSFTWTPSEYLDCSDCPYPKILRLQKENTFTVTTIDNNGCTATASIRIKVEERNIWVPNVFSPNGDNTNDWFFPVAKEDSYKEIKYFKIYNRWGEQVFSNEHFPPNHPPSGWNGIFKSQKANPAVFAWVLEIEWKNGDVEKLFGDVTLLR